MTTNAPPITWRHLVKLLRQYAPWWIGTTLAFGLLGVAASFAREREWEANQPLLVRDEANGSLDRMGKFASQTELMAAQETLFEMARSVEVVEAALREIGPPESWTEPTWPSPKVVESVAQEQINLRAPKTSEFGKSEVVYLTARDTEPERARRLCEALFGALSQRLRRVREMRADSIVRELTQSRDLARANQEEAVAALRKLETSLGMDLSELRGLAKSVTGDSQARRVLNELQTELRAAEEELKQLENQREQVMQAAERPRELIVANGELLRSQPTLERLLQGLIDAQIDVSRLAGSLTAEHPRLQAAQKTRDTLQEQLREEASNVLRSLEPPLELARNKYQRLVEKQESLQHKLATLAAIRTDYSQLTDEVEHRTQLLTNLETALAEAEASRTAALTTNLVEPLGPAHVGEKPVGPGNKMIVLAATAAGLMLGFGGIFLVAPGPGGPQFGRRWSDRISGRRATDVPGTAPAPAPQLPFPDRRRPTLEWNTQMMPPAPNNPTNQYGLTQSQSQPYRQSVPIPVSAPHPETKPDRQSAPHSQSTPTANQPTADQPNVNHAPQPDASSVPAPRPPRQTQSQSPMPPLPFAPGANDPSQLQNNLQRAGERLQSPLPTVRSDTPQQPS